jgi:hypothetical protein
VSFVFLQHSESVLAVIRFPLPHSATNKQRVCDFDKQKARDPQKGAARED